MFTYTYKCLAIKPNGESHLHLQDFSRSFEARKLCEDMIDYFNEQGIKIKYAILEYRDGLPSGIYPYNYTN